MTVLIDSALPPESMAQSQVIPNCGIKDLS